ncbi:MAG TPA: FUSC family protein [Terriglobales bacterium]
MQLRNESSENTEAAGQNSDALVDSARTAVATLASLLLAKALKFPEYYWAPISTIIIMQSSIQPFQGAWQRFVGTALGATLGAVIATYVGRSALVYAVGIFVCGIFAAFSRAWSAYRVAAITFSIVVLISRGPAWVFAWHRFLEVSLGIAVALIALLVSQPKKKIAKQA